jgi:hypothetical protein
VLASRSRRELDRSGPGGAAVSDSDPLKAHHDALDRLLSH